jgi:hypothetical protein
VLRAPLVFDFLEPRLWIVSGLPTRSGVIPLDRFAACGEHMSCDRPVGLSNGRLTAITRSTRPVRKAGCFLNRAKR